MTFQRTVLLGGLSTMVTGAFAAGAAAADAGPSPADILNSDIRDWILYTWGAIIFGLIVYRGGLFLSRYIRHIACLNNETQYYFRQPSVTYGKIKRYLLDAPLFRVRHNREFKLSAAINMGVLPSRFQTLFVLGYFAMNVVFCVWSIEWTNPKESVVLGQLRNRTGVLAVLNMIPLFLLAGRNNPLIYWTGITFDTYNLIHRWVGRMVVIESLIHTLAWIINKVHTAGWAAVQKSFVSSSFIYTGLIGTCAFTFLLFHSPSPIRHAFYETFLHVHIAVAATAVAGVWLHCANLPQLAQVQAVVGIWVAERSIRMIRLVYRNIGAGGTQAEVEALPGDAVRVTVKLARPWRFTPGQHAYLYMPSLSLWMSHPFSVAWSDLEEDVSEEKGLVMNRHDIEDMRRKRETISFIIRARTGFTEKLFKKADLAPKGRFVTTAMVEGPYGEQKLHSYGTVLLFAAGVGITHQVPHVRDLVTGYATGSVAARKVVLVWIIQSPEHLEWIRPWMTTILGLPRRREILKILLFVTRPRSTKEIHSPSSSVQMFPGKPNIQALVDAEAEAAVGAMGVTVCGTGGLADDVRRASRRWMDKGNVDLFEESFSW